MITADYTWSLFICKAFADMMQKSGEIRLREEAIRAIIQNHSRKIVPAKAGKDGAAGKTACAAQMSA